VYGMAQRHSAEVEVESQLGKGTTVRLSFALYQGGVEGAVGAEPTRWVPVRQRVLVVDDDPMLLKSVCDALEGDGHVVVTANGGQAGIEAFMTRFKAGEPFNVVITDLGMPYIDGRKVATAIKGISPSTPVVLLTGWGHRLMSEDGVPENVDRVLSKPPRLAELRDALARLAQEQPVHG
jgi:CheY-like chemotaxis protein